MVALGAPAALATPVGMVREIPIHTNVTGIGAGPEGNLWFATNLRHDWIGRITPAGKVKKFGGLGRGVEPTEIVAGPDGNLWFSHAAILTPTGQAIGRISPQGEISEFSTGLREEAQVTNLTAGPDGSIWFGDQSDQPAIGRITPAGEITEFGGLEPEPFPILKGPTPGPEGNLYFSANEDTVAVERISPTGEITRFRRGLDPQAEDVGPFAAVDGMVWFRVEKNAPRRRAEAELGLTAIGQLNPAGKITEFSKCLRPMPSYSGPNYLTRGPEGDVWFTTWPSGESADPKPASVPSIGRISPEGKITEFRYGLKQDSQPEELLRTGGRLWFIDRRSNSIGEVKPPRAPANTFIMLSPRLRRGTASTLARVYVPGPGRLRLHVVGLRVGTAPEGPAAGQLNYAAKARQCGEAGIPIFAGGSLRRELHDGTEVRISARVTFTPHGGTPFSQKTTVKLLAPR
jgi:streptogramin lyase